MLSRIGRRLVLATALLATTAVTSTGCGEILADLAEQRHIYKATNAYVFESDPAEIWKATQQVLAAEGFTLSDSSPVLNRVVTAAGTQNDDSRSRIEVRLSKSGRGYALELVRVDEERVEDVSWESSEKETDRERESGVANRMGSAGHREGERMVYDAPAYRVWAEARQELIDAGIEVPDAEVPTGTVETPWIETSEQRSRRIIRLEKIADAKTAVSIQVERQKKNTKKRWQERGKQRQGKMQLAVIEKVAPADAARILADARGKSNRASKVGDKIDQAVGEAVEEAVKQEQEL
jgi:hypothetical protein